MLWMGTLPSLAQQFPTDGIYLEHYDRKECLARVEAQIEKMKKDQRESKRDEKVLI